MRKSAESIKKIEIPLVYGKLERTQQYVITNSRKKTIFAKI